METNNVIALLSSIRSRANELLTHELAKAGLRGIAPSHGYILYVLFNNDGISMKEITHKINKKKNTVTVLIEKLIGQGFLRKAIDKNDRRTTRIFLNQKGKALEKAFDSISKKLIDTAYRGFTEREKSTLVTLLNRMAANFQ
jgi:MarR family transcriptional regulator, organic hydroperoxide resistance regulator